MTIERSHGKPRATLPRSRALTAVDSASDPSEGRRSDGRFDVGNQHSRGSGQAHVIAKAMQLAGLTGDVRIVVADTGKLSAGALRQLGPQGTIVRQGVYSWAREAALAAYFDTKANELGLTSAEGLRLVERASFHRQRAERLSVTLVDLVGRLKPAKKPFDIRDLMAALPKTNSEALDEDDAPDDDADDDADDADDTTNGEQKSDE